MHELELACIPVVQYVLEKNVIDLYEEAFEIIDTCTFCSKSISPAMWSVFGLIYKAFKEDACDHIEGEIVFAIQWVFQNIVSSDLVL